MIDKKILHYKIQKKLGQGGMGIVYLAEDTKLERQVAIKFLPGRISTNSDERKRFEQEAKSAAALNHPNIATIHAIEHTDDEVFIVMEYIEGQELKQIIEKAKGKRPKAKEELPIANSQSFTENRLLTTDYCLQIAAQIASGLQAAHEKGIVHRDIKSSNIMITEKGLVKIMDFGLAKFRGAAQLTREGTTVGTAAYMSPEQARGDEMNHTADIWSFGVVLYELLTGKLPFKGDYEQAVIYSILNESPQLDGYEENVPVELKNIVRKSLMKKSEDRYKNIGEILDELKQLTASSQSVIRTQPEKNDTRKVITKPVIIISSLLVSILIIVFGYYIYDHQKDVEYAREVLLPQIDRLAEDMPWTGEGLQTWQAFELSNQAKEYLSDDPYFEKIQNKYSIFTSFTTDPPGADVYVKPYGTLDSAWYYLGQTPIDSTRLPISFLRVKIEKPGYRTIQDIIWIWVSFKGYAYSMTTSGEIPEEMVKVSGSEELGDFLIDRFEVTNRQYKRFMQNGGYQNKDYWQHEIRFNGKFLSWEEAIKLMTDKTGVTGPATWEVGDYPEGQDDYPVSGINWYEAAAYAEFAGKSLPSYHHWQHTAATFHQAEIIPLSNINGAGTFEVGSSHSMNRFGTYDMAGNVREWCFNKVAGTEKRYILGGGWNDPDYTFSNDFAQYSFDRSSTNGLRCIKFLPTSNTSDDIFKPIKREMRNLAEEKPVSDEKFKDLLRQYSYDNKPLNAKSIEEDTSPEEWIKQTVVIDAAYNEEQITIYLFLPKNTQPPYQTVVYFPGSGSTETISSKNLQDFRQIDFFPKSGRAVIYPVYKGTYERYVSDDIWEFPTLVRDLKIKQVQDFQRVIDYLETRDDISSDQLAYYGFSMGGFMGPLILGVENRLKAAVLYVAGLVFWARLPEVDPLNFAPRVKMPVLMLNGRFDDVVPYEASQKPLYERLGASKEHMKWLVYDNGHSVPRAELIKETLNWLDEYLGPVD
jgi:eukaryotic-like serine/threonine-protein kinase